MRANEKDSAVMALVKEVICLLAFESLTPLLHNQPINQHEALGDSIVTRRQGQVL